MIELYNNFLKENIIKKVHSKKRTLDLNDQRPPLNINEAKTHLVK